MEAISFDARASYKLLTDLCKIGPRPSGSAGMAEQQEILTRLFAERGGKVSRQEFRIRHPIQGTAVTLANLVVEFHPDRKERILLCAHYDTRPFPDMDPKKPRGIFVGANDGASGAALLAEMARDLAAIPGKIGVDVVLFDGEEFVFEDAPRQDYFLGSTHFAQHYAGAPPAHRYRCGVLVDMIGDASLELYQEKNSLAYPGGRQIIRDIWGVAAELGVKEFIPRTRHDIRDDHLVLNEVAKIPTIDIIDFDYPYPGARQSFWHTEADTPDKCSAESLGKVAAVLTEWLRRESRK